MHDDQLLRYSRHILLDEIGIEGQERICAAHVLILGAGGLGAPAALYLAASGVGQITVIDDDVVDLTNLQRQIAHTTARIGQPKVDSLVQARTIAQRADAALLDGLLAQGVTVVLDCCDNYRTRQMVNAACVRQRVPLVSGAAIRLDAQISVFNPRQDDAPCYACLFDPDAEFEEIQCSTLGVLAPLVGIVGGMQAAEALKLIVGTGRSLAGRLLLLDARTMEVSRMHTAKNPECQVCGSGTAP